MIYFFHRVNFFEKAPEKCDLFCGFVNFKKRDIEKKSGQILAAKRTKIFQKSQNNKAVNNT